MLDLTTIYGNEIIVSHGLRKPVRQYSGFAGAHGATAMHLGSRGYPITVRGTIRVPISTTYDAARSAMETAISAIEQYNWAGTDTYIFRGSTFSNVLFDDAFKPVLDGSGKMFFIAGGWLVCRFTARLRGLL
jgi:hypothetical protein